MRSRVGAAALVLVVALAPAGCGAPTPSPPVAESAPASGSVTPSRLPEPSPEATRSAAASANASASSAGSGLAIDPALLDLLPPTLAGLDRHVDRDVDARAFGDPALRAIGTAGASALYADPATGDFAYATLIRLIGGRIGDSAFRAYRDSFDAGACSQAGGVAGHAETTLGGRRTFVGSCAGGLLTYHAVIPSAGVLVSVSSAGDRRLGEQLMNAAGD